MKFFKWLLRTEADEDAESDKHRPKPLILLEETASSRIVQRRHEVFGNRFIIARERYKSGKWAVSSYLYTNQLDNLSLYQAYFDWDEENERNIIGKTEQFYANQ